VNLQVRGLIRRRGTWFVAALVMAVLHGLFLTAVLNELIAIPKELELPIGLVGLVLVLLLVALAPPAD